MIPFGEWAPDQGPTIPGLCMVADGVLPKAQSYGPFAGPSVPVGAVALGAAPRGGFAARLTDGSWRIYALTETELFILGADYSWTSVEAGFTGPDAGNNWSCAQFGKFLLITNVNDGMWAYDIELGGTGTYISAAGDPGFIFTANSQVIGLNTLDNSGTRDNRRVKTSAFGKYDVWSGEGADGLPLASGGALLAGGDLLGGNGLLIQDSALRIIKFGNFGNGRYFAIDTVSEALGTVSAQSCVFLDGAAYWLATDGFCKLAAGGGVQRIGAGKIDKWFLDRVDQAALGLVQGAVDPFNKVVVWRFKREDVVSETVFENVIVHSWQWGKWVTAPVATSYLLRFATPGYGVDDYDAAVDDVDIPVDDRFWAGGQPLFGALNGDFKMALFSGTALQATLETSVSPNSVTGVLQWCRPNTDASEATIEVGTSDNLQTALTWATGAAIDESGLVPLDARGLNVAFRMTIPAGSDWTDARGIAEVIGSKGGRR